MVIRTSFRVGFSTLLVSLAVLLGFGLGLGCRSKPEQPMSIRESRMDVTQTGRQEFRFTTGQLFAFGNYAQGRCVGVWYYLYPSGDPYMVVSYDQDGRLNGRSWLWAPNGTLVSGSGQDWFCDDGGFAMTTTGWQYCPWSLIAEEEHTRVLGILPSWQEGWRGTGEYTHGEVMAEWRSVKSADT